MNCTVCGEDFLRCNCVSAQPFCEQCSEDSICGEEFPAECVKYHSYDTSPPSALTCLGINNGDSIEHIVEIIGNAVCDIHIDETPLVATDTSTIDFTTSGTKGHNLTGSVKRSSTSGNSLQILSDGLYVDYTGKVRINSTDPLDYLEDQIVGGSVQSFIQNTIQNDSGILEVIPTIDIDAFIDETGLKVLTVQDTNSVDLTLSDVSLSTQLLIADVKISAASGNTIVIHSDGLYSPGGGVLTGAQNGVNAIVTPNVVELGGTLLHDTSITITAPSATGISLLHTKAFAALNYSSLNAFLDLNGGAASDTLGGYHYALGGQFLVSPTGAFTLQADAGTSYTGTYGAVIARGSGSTTGNIISGGYFGGFGADTVNVSAMAGVRISGLNTAPLTIGAAYTGTVTNYYGLFIEDIGISDYNARITNKFAIYQKGTGDISRFFGPVQNAASAVQFTSDIRVKENIEEFQSGLKEIDKINTKSFNYTYNKGRRVTGVIAQELEKVLPEAVSRGNFEVPDGPVYEDFRFVDQTVLFYTMLNAIKELSTKVQSLEAQIYS